MSIELPFPHKVLWPNGRTRSPQFRNREFQKHKEWARLATMATLGPCLAIPDEERFRMVVTVYPKTRHAIDKDNASSAMKAYQDGIATAMKVNDSRFEEPRIQFGEPVKGGKVVVTVDCR